MNVKIFVVSLVSSLSRRKNITTQMAEQSLQFEFFDAINGKNEHHPFFDLYSDPKRIRRKGYSLNPSELGCFASHYLLWEKCVNLNQPILILEDDIKINGNFIEALTFAEKYIDQLGVLKICRTLDTNFINLVKFSPSLTLVKYNKPTSGAMGYIISPEAAKKLMDKTVNWHEPVDDFMEKEWLHKVRIFGVEPPCLTIDNEIESEIGDRKKIKISIFKRLRREIYRSSERILNQIQQLLLNIKIKLGLFKIEQNS